MNKTGEVAVAQAKETFKSKDDYIVDELHQQRDELLAALRDIARMPEGDEESAQAIARAVIAKAQPIPREEDKGFRMLLGQS